MRHVYSAVVGCLSFLPSLATSISRAAPPAEVRPSVTPHCTLQYYGAAMAKKNKDSEPVVNLHSVANRDIIQRINFLYQASTYLNSVSQALPASAENVQPQQPAPSVKGKSKKKQKVRHPRNTAELSRSYIGSMRTVGQKTMVRMYELLIQHLLDC